MKSQVETVGILGAGEIGSAIAEICQEAGYQVLIRELKYDQIANNKVDYLHINIPEKNNKKFIQIAVEIIKELKPKLTLINSSVTPGTTRKIFKKTRLPIVHSPVLGIHPNLAKSIKFLFPKIIGPVDTESLKLAKKHLQSLGLKIEVYDSAEDSEAAKLLDLVYYAWNIIFCRFMDDICTRNNLNFSQVYTKHNQIYNNGYRNVSYDIVPSVVRPILIPVKGPIGGHCTIPDTVLFHKFYRNRFTKFILDEQERYTKELVDAEQEQKSFLKVREKVSKKLLISKVTP